MIKDVIIMISMFLLLVITLMNSGIHIDRIMLVIFFIWTVIMSILTFKPKLFKKYLRMREKHKKINREQLGE